MNVPIFLDHNPLKIIGKSEIINGEWIITFLNNFEITREQLFNIMDCGFIILESEKEDNIEYLKKIKIVELSLPTIKTEKEQ